jgi:hypothetical protein
MSPISHLEREAERRRALFAASLLELRSRLTLAGLVDLAVGYLDPRSTHLRPVYSAVRRNPLVAASVVAGAAWLLQQSLQDSAGRSSEPGRRVRLGRTRVRFSHPSASKKEPTHDHD